MNGGEAIQMMKRASAEIRSLRARIAQLEPRAEAWESVTAILRLLPQPSRGMGEDVAWLLDRRIRELEAVVDAEQAASKAPAEGPA